MRMRRSSESSRRSVRRSDRSDRSDRNVHFRPVMRRATILWTDATAAERTTAAFVMLAALSLTGVAISVVAHISTLLAFLFLPTIIFPLLFVFAASFSVFVFVAASVTGAGFFLIGAPMMAAAAMFKILAPVVLLGFAAKVAMGKLFKGNGDNETGTTETLFGLEKDDALRSSVARTRDVFDSFDRRLGLNLDRRLDPLSVGIGRVSDVSLWTVEDVLDELVVAGLGNYRDIFLDEHIDGETLLGLTAEDVQWEFREEMPLRDRKKLTQLIVCLRSKSKRL